MWRGEVGTDGLPDGYYYRMPAGNVVAARGYLLIFRNESDLSLPASDGALHLVRPDLSIADSFLWNDFLGFDRSYSRLPDGTGPWGKRDVTPGRANRAEPTPRPQPTAIPYAGPAPASGTVGVAGAYGAAPDTRITIEGRVTVPPALFGDRILYVQDRSAGIKLYLRYGRYPSVNLGDRVRVTGYVREFHKGRELSVPSSRWITVLGPGSEPQPRYVRTGSLGAGLEGRLIMVVGAITGFRENRFWLDDGSGGAQIYVDSDLSWQRPYFNKGDEWAVIGVVSRYDDSYRIMPRYQTDISPPPGILPATGGSH